MSSSALAKTPTKVSILSKKERSSMISDIIKAFIKAAGVTGAYDAVRFLDVALTFKDQPYAMDLGLYQMKDSLLTWQTLIAVLVSMFVDLKDFIPTYIIKPMQRAMGKSTHSSSVL